MKITFRNLAKSAGETAEKGFPALAIHDVKGHLPKDQRFNTVTCSVPLTVIVWSGKGTFHLFDTQKNMFGNKKISKGEIIDIPGGECFAFNHEGKNKLTIIFISMDNQAFELRGVKID